MKPAASLQSALCLLCLGVSILVLNALQMLTIVIRPFSMRAFRACNRALAASWWGMAVVAWKAIGVEVVYSGDAIPHKENAVVFSNHQCMPDILIQLDFARRQGMLEHLKWMAKAPLRKLPGIGWGLSFLDTVFLRRTWADDAENIRATFARITENRLPFWLMIFPEGTRLTPQKLKRSQNYASKKGFPMFQHVMLPRTRGFVAAVQGLGSQADAVYDLTLAFEGEAPSVWRFFRGDCRRIHLHAERFPVDGLPASENALETWLQERFSAKEARLARFASTRKLG